MEDLKQTTLARPFDPNAGSHDLNTLRQLAAELNNPALTGAVVPPEEREAIKAMTARVMPAPAAPMRVPAAPKRALDKPKVTNPVPPQKPLVVVEEEPLQIPKMPESRDRAVFASAPAVPATTNVSATPSFVFPEGVRAAFFTGHSKSGKSWLAQQAGAKVLELEDPIRAMAASSFGEQPPEAADIFLNEIFAWGDGLVSKAYPLTGARALFIEKIRSEAGDKFFGIPSAQFGTPGFWVRSLISRVNTAEGKVIITSVYTGDQYTALRDAGFAPVHVMCNNITRTSRGGTPLVNQLSEIVERDLIKKVSASPSGPKLWSVWCDTSYSPPSPRLLTIEEFLTGWRAL